MGKTMSISMVHDVVRPCGQYLFKINNLNEERVDQVAQARFLNHFFSQKFSSLAIDSVAILLGVGAAYFAMIGASVISVSLIVSGIAVAIHGYHRENDPNQLMRNALRAIEDGNESRALELIQRGANIDICSTETIWSVFPDLFDLACDLIRGNLAARKKMPFSSDNIFDQAAHKGQKQILNYLSSIGFDFEKTRALQKAESLELIRYLVEELRMPVNGPVHAFSPLYMQIISMKSKIKNSVGLDSFDRVKEKIGIIRYLLQKGASFKVGDSIRGQDYEDLCKRISEVQPGGETENQLVKEIIDRYRK
jgi:hypothetical protein